MKKNSSALEAALDLPVSAEIAGLASIWAATSAPAPGRCARRRHVLEYLATNPSLSIHDAVARLAFWTEAANDEDCDPGVLSRLAERTLQDLISSAWETTRLRPKRASNDG